MESVVLFSSFLPCLGVNMQQSMMLESVPRTICEGTFLDMHRPDSSLQIGWSKQNISIWRHKKYYLDPSCKTLCRNLSSVATLFVSSCGLLTVCWHQALPNCSTHPVTGFLALAGAFPSSCHGNLPHHLLFVGLRVSRGCTSQLSDTTRD